MSTDQIHEAIASNLRNAADEIAVLLRRTGAYSLLPGRLRSDATELEAIATRDALVAAARERQ